MATTTKAQNKKNSKFMPYVRDAAVVATLLTTFIGLYTYAKKEKAKKKQKEGLNMYYALPEYNQEPEFLPHSQEVVPTFDGLNMHEDFGYNLADIG